jgi:hypothetical protein
MLICLEDGGILGLHDLRIMPLKLGWREYYLCARMITQASCAGIANSERGQGSHSGITHFRVLAVWLKMVLKVLLPLGGIDPSSLCLFLVVFCVLCASCSCFSHKIWSEVQELCWRDAACLEYHIYRKEMNYVGFRVKPYLDHHLWDRDRAVGKGGCMYMFARYKRICTCYL